MTRREIRENVFKLIFIEGFHDNDEYEDQAEQYMENVSHMSEKDRTYIMDRAKDIVEHTQEIDEAISKVSKGWTLDRMGKAEVAILRLAYYEIKIDESIPTNVAINEAVELAKKYAEDGDGAFVNGILAKLV